MSSGITPKSVVLWFVLVAVLYYAAYSGIEHLRHRKGPWQVVFGTNDTGEATATIAQAHHAISNVRVVLHGERLTNRPGTVLFDRVERPLPFGRILYQDLTFLPGVVTFDWFGHEIEVRPRELVINRRAVAWSAGLTIDLWPTNKPPHPPLPPKRR